MPPLIYSHHSSRHNMAASLVLSKQELQRKIKDNGERLTQLTGPEDKRIKKRVLQTLGKLKKQLAEVDEKLVDVSSSTTTTTSDSGTLNNDKDVPHNDITETEAETSTPVMWTKKQAKLKLRVVNAEIADLALKKQLKMARKRFNWLSKKGLCPDVHSYTNLLNAYVRCGDVTGAEAVWAAMVQSSEPATTSTTSPVTPNVVTCTTLIKGYCEGGMMKEAQSLFLRMAAQGSANIGDISVDTATTTAASASIMPSKSKNKKAKRSSTRCPALPPPNSRTLNTLLRGCIRGGEVAIAHNVFAVATTLEGDLGVDICDETSMEYVIYLYCQSLQLEAAQELYDLFVKLYAAPVTTCDSEGMVSVVPPARSALAATHVNLSRAYALIGDHDSSEEYERLSRVSIKEAKSNILLDAMKHSAAKDKGGGETGGNNSTSALFQQHRYSELTRDCDLISAYNEAYRQSQFSSGSSTHENASNFQDEGAAAVLCLSRVLLLSELSSSAACCSATGDSSNPNVDLTYQVAAKRKLSNDHSDPDPSNVNLASDHWSRDLKSSMVSNLLEKFGLQALCQSQTCGEEEGSSVGLKARAINAVLRNISAATETAGAGAGTRSGCCIRFDRLFSLCAGAGAGAASEGSGVDVKLEIGSGSGEWVVQQAISDQERQSQSQSGGRVLWVSLEQRLDRVHQTFLHSLLRMRTLPHHLAMLGGDASLVLPELIHDQSLSQIFVNHPEPPERSSGGEDMSQGKHLLTAHFFREMHRALKEGGTVTIVSDNRLYATALAKVVDGLNSGHALFSSPDMDTCPDADDNGYTEFEQQQSRKNQYHRHNQQAMLPSRGTTGNDRDDDSDSDSDGDEFLVGDDDPSRCRAKTTPAAVAKKTTVWSGDPGSRAGHVAAHVSSYFSRLWKNGNKSRVWYLYLVKEAK